MSKFAIIGYGAGQSLLAYDRPYGGAKYVQFATSDLADLYSCVGAALAEHNSGVMGGAAPEGGCVCRLKVTKYATEVCGHYAHQRGVNGCANWNPINTHLRCGHFEACHSTQNTKDQEQDK